MTNEQYMKNLCVPTGRIDVVLDTDAYNEIDDQFAIAYMLLKKDKLNVKAICAAPFEHRPRTLACEGVEQSYNEIIKLLKLMDMPEMAENVFMGAGNFLKDEASYEKTPASEEMVRLARLYTPENPLYIVAIGAITNVASAILMDECVKENCVIVWLGGHSHDWHKGADEYNMTQDIAAARVVLDSGIPFVQLPCVGVVDRFYTTKPELEYWLKGKNKISDYLCENTIAAAERYASGKPWSRVIWDVTAIGWLLNENDRLMYHKLVPAPIPEYDKNYSFDESRHLIRCVTYINRDALITDLFETLTGK